MARNNVRNNARKREENELYENVLDLVLGTLYITSYIIIKNRCWSFALSRQFSCQHWLGHFTAVDEEIVRHHVFLCC